MIPQEELIVVYGEALVDLFKNASVVGGAPFNVARHIAGFNQEPLFISAIGEDNAGDLILSDLKKFNLYADGVQIIKDKHSGTVQVHENAAGHRFEIMPDCAYDFIEATLAIKSLDEFIQINQIGESYQPILYHGSLGLRERQSRHTFLNIKKILDEQTDFKVYLDLNWRDGHVTQLTTIQIIQAATILKVSIEELQMIEPWFNVEQVSENKLPEKQVLSESIRSLMSQINAKLLLVTYGNLGSAAFDHLGRCISSAPVIDHVKVVDTVGAGDAFSSVMLLGLLKKWPLDLALMRANHFAASICAIRGAIPESLDFYEYFNFCWKKQESTLKA